MRLSLLALAAIVQPIVFTSGLSAQQQGPNWWYTPSDGGAPVAVTPAASAADNQTVANIGQAKWMAMRAIEEMEAQAPGSALGDSAQNEGDAGYQSLSELYDFLQVSSGANVDNFAPLNLGQLKSISAPFYERFDELSIDPLGPTSLNLVPTGAGYSIYPWTDATEDDLNYALAQLGQLKHVLGFQLGSHWVPTTDGDGDGIPDWWIGSDEVIIHSIKLSSLSESLGVYTVQIAVQDARGSAVAGAAVTIAKDVGTGTLSNTVVTTDSQGTASFTYEPSSVGAHILSAALADAKTLRVYIDAPVSTPHITQSAPGIQQDRDPLSESGKTSGLVGPYSDYYSLTPGQYTIYERHENGEAFPYWESPYDYAYGGVMLYTSTAISEGSPEIDRMHLYLASDFSLAIEHRVVREGLLPQVPVLTASFDTESAIWYFYVDEFSPPGEATKRGHRKLFTNILFTKLYACDCCTRNSGNNRYSVVKS